MESQSSHQAEQRRQTDRSDPKGNGNGNGEQHDVHEENPIPHDLPTVSNFGVVIALVVIVAAFIALFFIGWLPEHRQQEKLNEEAKSQDLHPIVEVMTPQRGDKALDLTLPVDIDAYQDTMVYPRTNGYLKTLMVDIGDRVQANQQLAQIETPETDADLNQANADEGQAEANLKKSQDDLALAETTYKRYQDVGSSGGITEQELDEKRAAYTQAQSAMDAFKAAVNSAKANVDRLVSLQGFEKVVAPFSGKVTARNFDVGALLSPTSAMFRVTQDDTMRIFCNVPQAYINSLKIGGAARLIVRNYPGTEFQGTITRIADAIDQATRTMRCEIDVPNKDGKLYANMYGQIVLTVKPETPPVMVPTSAVIFDSQGTKVWYVEDGKAHAKKIELGRDYGTEVEVPSGLNGDETIITNPGERLVDGIEVDVAAETPAPTAGSNASPSTDHKSQQASAK